MVIEKIGIVECDYCGKKIESSIETKPQQMMWNKVNVDFVKIPLGWFFLNRLKVVHRVKDTEKGIKKLNINEDPQFCCKLCLLRWIELNLGNI